MGPLNDALDQCPVIAIIRAQTIRYVPAVLAVLADAGITAVEIALTTPGALDAARRSVPAGFVLGAGTVLDGVPVAERLDRAVTCGAFTTSTVGDWEGLPAHGELGLLGGADVVR